ncbi:MAG: hypothetical protein K9N23_09360, partial [Akkermansiaceae bacterium]|nr:hypothetical protein [Akkermansiaceae bacterium]
MNPTAIARAAIHSTTALIIAGLAALHAAEVPKQVPVTRYSSLWTQSPFTTPPPPPLEEEKDNPFDELALRGIAPLSNGGYLITLVNIKTPTETITIDTERSTDYKVEKVERHPEKLLGTIVHLKKGSMTGTVTYDEKLSKPKAPPPSRKPPVPGQPQTIPGQPPTAQPTLPGGIRPPRQRVVVPPPAPT